MAAKVLWEDDRGVIIPYLAMMLAVIVGLAALALDASRLMHLQTQLQSGADALALAGAAELDRRPDSIIRAQAAILDILRNQVTGDGGNQSVQVASIDFLASLPTSDDLPITPSNLTEDPTLAAYVRVTTIPVSLQTIFPTSFTAGRLNIGLSAESVAGYDQAVCNITPLYVCNPFETPGMTYYEATQALIAANQDSASQHRLIRLAGIQASNGEYGAGRIGYIAPSTGALPSSACGPSSAYGVPQALATTQVRACYRLSSVNLLPSDDPPAMDGLNTRFDIYANAFSNCRIYPPDQNVRKGFVAAGNVNWCNAQPASPIWPMPDPTSAALPVDQSMIGANGTFNRDMDLGDGTWNCAAYWNIAHSVGSGKNLPPPGCTAAATISRYSVYQYEMNFLNDRSLAAETGAPQCAPPGATLRRVISAAIVNCGSSPVPMHEAAQDVPAAAFGRFFLVLPASPNSAVSPYAEFLGLVKRSDPESKDIVILKR
jgi:hypothetical protein